MSTTSTGMLVDQYWLSQNVLFQGRVQESLVTTAQSVYAESTATAGHAARATLATNVLRTPMSYTVPFAIYVASNATVAGQAGGVTSPTDTAQASVTDVAINNAVSAVWNGVAGA